MSSRLFTFLVLLFAQTVCFSSDDNTSALRSWTDTQGRKMHAELIRLDSAGEMALFRKASGTAYRFPLNQLVKKDRLFIQNASRRLLILKGLEDTRTYFEKALDRDLLRIARGTVKQIQKAPLVTKDYYVLYYSAGNCSICRNCTPQLVNFYNYNSSQYDNFEIIFVSSDRSVVDMENYMKTTRMPWLALDFNQRKSAHTATMFSSDKMPNLILFDREGYVLAHSYVKDQYVGPTPVINALKKRLDNSL